MWIIGCDYHPRFQHIAMVNTEGGEYGQRRLEHVGEAEQFYRSLAGPAVRVGMEASGQARWFERLLAELVTPTPHPHAEVCLTTPISSYTAGSRC